MKIVILDGYTTNPGDLSWADFNRMGELAVYDRTESDEIVEKIGDAEIILVNKVSITREIMEKCRTIKYIGVLATGYNVIDVKAAEELGIVVTNIPTYGTAAVAQFAIALLLEICHRIGAHSKEVMEGRWINSRDWCFWDYPLIELAGKTMGIIGYGRIGQATGRIAQALGLKILANDAYKNIALETENMKYAELDEIYKKSDVIVLHCPLLPETQGMICEESIEKMKDGVIIINNSRGPLIVEADLAEALKSGKVFAAGLDVINSEPMNADCPLIGLDNCIITPHISWATKEARQRLIDIARDNIAAFLNGNPVNVVK